MSERRNAIPIEHEPDLLPIGEVVAVVCRTHPDVTHSSLRFLEREGLITPVRTPGGHRLFSAADVDRIRKIKAWQAQRLSLEEIRIRLRAQADLADPAALAGRFLDAMLRGGAEARRLVLDADDLGLPLARLFQDVLRPALVEVGERWAAGTLRVGQEHEVTERARELIAELGRRHAPPALTGRPLLAAAVAGERHDLGLRMIVALLRARGRSVRFLGADVEARFLVEEVESRRPPVVLLSATRADRLPAVREAAARLRAAVPAPRLVLGGQFVGEHRATIERWGIVPVGDDLAAAVDTILSIDDQADD